ncbi:DUF2207 domain-containing protein, partial [Patescibacteria group bacterium]
MMKKYLVFVFSTLVFLFLFSQEVVAKDYWIRSADINVQLNLDGSADITETRHYYFSESYSWADEWIDLKAKCQKGVPCENYIVEGVTLSDEEQNYSQSTSGDVGTYELSQSEDKLYLRWYYSATDEEKIFTFKYHIQNAITSHKDTSEFYWQLIGDGWSKATEKVYAKIVLPISSPGDQIWAYGHGPLNGTINIVSDSEIDFQADNLSANKFFEVRALFPKGNFVNARAGNLTLADIQKQEKGFAVKTMVGNFGIIALMIAVAGLIVWRGIYWFVKWFKIGRDKPLPEVNLAGTLHEPPSDLAPI